MNDIIIIVPTLNEKENIEILFNKLNTTGNVQIYKSLKSRRHNPPIDLETLNIEKQIEIFSSAEIIFSCCAGGFKFNLPMF